MTLQFPSLRLGLAQRVTGPGGLYNLGNALGLLCGLSLHVTAAEAGLSQGTAAIVDYFIGSLGASAITLAMLIFFWSGERYHCAWTHGTPPDAALNRVGDISSGWGALALGCGLFLLDQPVLAATSGLLHAAGKFGSALPPAVQRRLPFGPAAFRLTVIASRLPALAALLIEAQSALAGQSAQPIAATMLLVLCYIFWLKADAALMRS